MSHAHAKILLQNCYHKVALVALLQNCYDSNDSVALAAMRYEKCYNNYRKILWLLNRSVAGRAWAEVLDGLMPQELEAVLFEVTSRQRVLWFGDVYRPLEVGCVLRCDQTLCLLCADMQDKMHVMCVFCGRGVKNLWAHLMQLPHAMGQ